ncbi:MAG: hypothetical protein ACK4IB_11545 [Erythrobacter sp.]|jgi:hypothetical protein
MPDNFQRGASPPPAPAGGDFFGLAALVFGAGAIIMLVAAIVAMYVSSKSEDAVAVEPEMVAPMIAEEPAEEAVPAEGEADAETADAMAPAEAEAPAPATP